MNTAAATLLPIFRSNLQADILAKALLNPDRSFTTADLARQAGADYATTHREVHRLLKAHILTSERLGQANLVRANTRLATYPPLADLLRVTYGPTAVLPAILAGIPDVDAAYIYGSWAARRSGEPGDEPADIDVLVIGDPQRNALYDASEAAEKVLNREVNIRAVTAESWNDAEEPLLRTIKSRPFIELDLVSAG